MSPGIMQRLLPTIQKPFVPLLFKRNSLQESVERLRVCKCIVCPGEGSRTPVVQEKEAQGESC